MVAEGLAGIKEPKKRPQGRLHRRKPTWPAAPTVAELGRRGLRLWHSNITFIRRSSRWPIFYFQIFDKPIGKKEAVLFLANVPQHSVGPLMVVKWAACRLTAVA